jgi:hypothetical protein
MGRWVGTQQAGRQPAEHVVVKAVAAHDLQQQVGSAVGLGVTAVVEEQLAFFDCGSLLSCQNLLPAPCCVCCSLSTMAAAAGAPPSWATA